MVLLAKRSFVFAFYHRPVIFTFISVEVYHTCFMRTSQVMSIVNNTVSTPDRILIGQ